MTLVFGIILAVIATIFINYSNFRQKKVLSTLPRIEVGHLGSAASSLFNSRAWLIAWGLMLLGTGIHNIAVGLAPLSVVQPINAAGVCLLVVLAVVGLGERLLAVDVAGIGSILLGVIFLSVSLVRPTKAFSYRPVILWFFLILFLAVSVISLVIAFLRSDERTPVLLGIGVGLLVGLGAILVKMTWNDIGPLWARYRIVGVLSSSYLWLAIIVSVVAMVMYQIALQRGMAIIVVPLVTGFSNLIPIIVGLLALREPFPKEPRMVLFRLASFVLIIGGAVLLSMHRPGEQERKSLNIEPGRLGG